MEAMDVDIPVGEEEEEVIDELVLAFDAIEESSTDLSVYAALMNNERVDDAAIRIKERCIYRITRIHTEAKNVDEVSALMKKNSEFFGIIPKAKTAKIVRSILELVAKIPDSVDIQLKLCNDLVSWCEQEKRTFLRQRIEARLSALYLLKKMYPEGQELVTKLLSELKKLDDKQMLTEVHLTEARLYHALENIPKAKASLTASRSAANSIYVVPLLQAELDEMSGVLCCEEGDNSTAYSYFQEAYDSYDGALDTAAVRVLKYMVLSKTLDRKSGEAEALFSSKAGLKYTGAPMEAMHAVANAVKARSLEDFETAVKAHSEHLHTDDLISHHLTSLYDSMFEANLLKIIFPFSSVEIAHVAKLINLPVPQVERKLSQMILDKKFSGILDQGKGFLDVFDGANEDKAFSSSSEILTNMGQVVDTLMDRAKKHNNGE
eukprot:GSChrysophyteH2.ASY1.ANO1.241.1 assembled CDS